MKLDRSRFGYIATIIYSKVKLKDSLTQVTFNELRFVITKGLNSEKPGTQLQAQKRMNELKTIYPIDEYPEKWI